MPIKINHDLKQPISVAQKKKWDDGYEQHEVHLSQVSQGGALIY